MGRKRVRGMIIYTVILLSVMAFSIFVWTKEGTEFLRRKGILPEEKTAVEQKEVTGWISIDGQWRYRMEDGQWMKACWFVYKANWYYMDEDGYMQTGWKKIDGELYFFTSKGVMVKDTEMLYRGETYCFDGSGKCTGRKKGNGSGGQK